MYSLVHKENLNALSSLLVEFFVSPSNIVLKKDIIYIFQFSKVLCTCVQLIEHSNFPGNPPIF